MRIIENGRIVISKIIPSGVKGRIIVVIKIKADVISKGLAGLLLKKNLCVLMTSITNYSVIIDTKNHPVLNCSDVAKFFCKKYLESNVKRHFSLIVSKTVINNIIELLLC
jgi:hypothetical protein